MPNQQALPHLSLHPNVVLHITQQRIQHLLSVVKVITYVSHLNDIKCSVYTYIYIYYLYFFIFINSLILLLVHVLTKQKKSKSTLSLLAIRRKSRRKQFFLVQIYSTYIATLICNETTSLSNMYVQSYIIQEETIITIIIIPVFIFVNIKKN